MSTSVSNPACIPTIQDKTWFCREDWLKRHSEHMKLRESSPCRVLLVGDSITDAWASTGKEAYDRELKHLDCLNIGIGGDATEHVLWRLEQGVIDGLQPEVICLLIGTNNIGNEGHNGSITAEGVACILSRLQKACPKAKVILHAVFPRDAKPQTPFRQEIAQLNAGIRRLADGEQVIWLDMSEAFLEKDGSISAETMPDFLHLSAKSYDVWAKTLRERIEGLMVE